ncbi:thioesterase family protein [Zhongshania sp.]|jgi:acyl-CoA thioesterase|uniref:acyl-CoA thioesterase n=1 Tax=Zhongshania sp. TaxID=1971902 RepID=UPI001B491508|nr:thioesterase family protein [Zhongshania sp.]MBQ0796281.1 thioesterase family protein [Zhongshania sp.]
MKDFKTLLSGVRATQNNNEYTVDIEETWLQGRTAFGGLSAALIVKAMLNQLPSDRRLRSLAVMFVGPVSAGEHRIVLRELRAGGSVTHIQGEIICNGEVGATVSAAFGKDRPSSTSLASPVMPQVAQPETFDAFPFIEGITPTFTQHFDMRLCSGSLPFSQADFADFTMWLRFKETGDLDLPALIAIADVPPMPGLNMIKLPGAGSSLSWYLEFPNQSVNNQMSDWWFYDYRSQAAGNGYFNNYATIWDSNGQAVMFSRQVATVFEK